MAPEVNIFTKYRCDAADIFSLGVVLFEMVFNMLPFGAQGANLTKRCKFPAKSPDFWHQFGHKNVSVELVSLLNLLLVENPNDRLGLEAIKHHPWLTKDVLMLD